MAVALPWVGIGEYGGWGVGGRGPVGSDLRCTPRPRRNTQAGVGPLARRTTVPSQRAAKGKEQLAGIHSRLQKGKILLIQKNRGIGLPSMFWGDPFPKAFHASLTIPPIRLGF